MASFPLFLSDVAGSEILLIMVFILIFFGSKSIPGIARTMGRTIRQIKDASQEVQDEIRKSSGDIKADFNLQKMVDETKNDIAKPFREHARTLDQAINFDPPKSFVQQEKQFDTPGLASEDALNQASDVTAVVQEAEKAGQLDKPANS